MAVEKNSCPYRVARKVAPVPVVTIEERFDFQIKEGGKVDRISLGVFDLVKEVESHKGEAGLINCLKLAEAKGIPIDSFAKTEDGLMADYSGIETLDDLLAVKASADAKFAKLAETYGLTVDQLMEIVKTGKFDQLKEPGQPEGGNE